MNLRERLIAFAIHTPRHSREALALAAARMALEDAAQGIRDREEYNRNWVDGGGETTVEDCVTIIRAMADKVK